MSLVEGCFSESLRGWKAPVALLWLDVDLYDSTRDVLCHVLPYVPRKGMICPSRIHRFPQSSACPWGSAPAQCSIRCDGGGRCTSKRHSYSLLSGRSGLWRKRGYGCVCCR